MLYSSAVTRYEKACYGNFPEQAVAWAHGKTKWFFLDVLPPSNKLSRGAKRTIAIKRFGP
jgi:hypothetical protein